MIGVKLGLKRDKQRKEQAKPTETNPLRSVYS